MCSVYRGWARPLRFDASHRIVTPRETFYFTALTLRIANRLCARLLQTRRNRRGGLVKMLSFVRARTNLHDPSTMLTLIELWLYRIAINFSTLLLLLILLLLLLLLRMILVEPCCGSPQIAFATAAYARPNCRRRSRFSSVLIINYRSDD